MAKGLEQGMAKGLEQGRRQEHDSFRLAVEAVRGSQQEPQLTATLASLLDKVSTARTAYSVVGQASLRSGTAALLVRCQARTLQLLKSWAGPGCHVSCLDRRPQPARSTFQHHGQCQATRRAA